LVAAHSMEEAEALCDRLGIFVNGELQCIGNAKELTARYGGLYVLTITSPPEEEFTAVEQAKKRLHIQAWGISDTTLEDVFIKVARGVNGGVALH
jgi:ABC-type multidrug transport system ATPase subunit